MPTEADYGRCLVICEPVESGCIADDKVEVGPRPVDGCRFTNEWSPHVRPGEEVSGEFLSSSRCRAGFLALREDHLIQTEAHIRSMLCRFVLEFADKRAEMVQKA